MTSLVAISSNCEGAYWSFQGCPPWTHDLSGKAAPKLQRLKELNLTRGASPLREGLPATYESPCIQFLRISIGTGKTTVVFFSTPISVKVCR
jgi:hypothetical protein